MKSLLWEFCSQKYNQHWDTVDVKSAPFCFSVGNIIMFTSVVYRAAQIKIR